MADVVPVQASNQKTCLNVIFVHGLDGDDVATWCHQGQRENYWLQWIAEDRPQFGVYALKYEAAKSAWSGLAMPLQLRGRNVLERLLIKPDLLSKPLLFIGHSMGGLVVKQMLREAVSRSDAGDAKAKALLEQFCGMVFLATPHSGSSYAKIFAALGAAAAPTAAIADLERDNVVLDDLNEWYRQWVVGQAVRHRVFCETQPCGLATSEKHGWWQRMSGRAVKAVAGLVVEGASANPGLLFVSPTPLAKDHFGMARPVNRGDELFVLAQAFYDELVADRPRRAEVFDRLKLNESQAQGIDPEKLRPIFEHLGQQDLSQADMIAKAGEAVAALLAKANEKIVPGNDGEEIDRILGEARQKLKKLDSAGALATLDEKLADQRRGAVLLLKEKVDIQRLTYDYLGLRASLMEMRALAPDQSFVPIWLGDLELTLGRTDAARVAYEEAKTLAEKSGDRRGQAVALERFGEILLRQGNADGALGAFRAGLAIGQERARADASDAQARRDLSISHGKIGDVLLRQGDGAGALAAYRASLAIREELVRADAADAQAQRDLSVSHNRIGDVLLRRGDGAGALAAYRAGLAISEALARADVSDAQAQRDLSISHERIGNALLHQGDGAGALEAYRASLAIAEVLARADASDAQAQRDLSTSHNKIGDALLRQGDGAGALAAYRADLAISEERARADASDAEAQRDLIISLVRIAEADPHSARKNLGRALAIAEDLDASGRLAPADQWMLANFRERLAALDG